RRGSIRSYSPPTTTHCYTCICRSGEVRSKLIAGTSSIFTGCHTPSVSRSGAPFTCRVQPEQLPGPISDRARIKTRPCARGSLPERPRMIVVIDVAKAELVIARGTTGEVLTHANDE